MPNSPTTVIWRNIPAGSTIRLQADGSPDDYELPVLIKLNRRLQAGLEVENLNPGPAEIEITAAGQKWDLAPTIIVVNALETPITLKASVVGSDGEPVSTSDGAGGTVPAEAQWESPVESGSMLDNVAILVRS